MSAKRLVSLAIVMCGVVQLAPVSARGVGVPLAGKIAGSSGTTEGMGPLEAEMIKKLRLLHVAGNSGEVLRLTYPVKLKAKSFAFCREMLLVQSEAYRRMGNFVSAANSLKQIREHVKKVLPQEDRKGAAACVTLALRTYVLSPGGVYRSRRRGAAKAKTAPGDPERISKDTAWEAAKLDCAEYVLEVSARNVRGIKSAISPENLLHRLNEALAGTDVVRPHFADLANRKAAELISAFVMRYDQIMDRACSKHLADVRDWHTGAYWRRYMRISYDRIIVITDGLLKTSRRLISINFGWGQCVTRYCRRHEMLGSVSMSISSLTSRRRTLEASFVRFDNAVWRQRKHPRPNDPYSKIPSGKW